MIALAIALPYLILFLLILQNKDQSRRVKIWTGVLCLYLAAITVMYAQIESVSNTWLIPLSESSLLKPAILVIESILISILTTTYLRREKELSYWLAGSIIWLLSLVIISSLDPTIPFANWGKEAVTIIGWGAITLLLTLNILATARKISPRSAANRIKFWLLPLGQFMIGSILAFSVSPDRQLIARIFHMLAAIAITYVFISKNETLFKSINTPIKHLIYVMSIGLLILTVVWVGLVVSRLSGSDIVRTLVTMAYAMTISVGVTYFSDRLKLITLSNDPMDTLPPAAKILYNYSQQINQQTELKQLAKFISQTIIATLNVENAQLILPTEYNSHILLEPYDEEFLKKGRTGIFTIKNPIYQYFSKNNDILLHYDLENQMAFAGLPRAEQEFLKALKAEIYAPIAKRGVIIGFLAVGQKKNGTNFSKNDIDLIFTYANQAATALENARLINDLQDSYKKTNKLNEALRTSNEHLQKIDKIKGDFISIASHELRTPLTVICGYSDMLREYHELPADQMQVIVDSLNESSNKMNEIIEMLIEVAQIDMEAIELNFDSVNVLTVINEAAAYFETALAERMLELTVEGFAQLPPIEADGELLRKVIYNLLSNAVKFTPNGGRIEISGQVEKSTLYPGSEAIHITITDTGIGIAPDEQNLVFEKFYRVDSTLTHSSGNIKYKGAGPGLGLTISKRIIEGHNGKIWVDSPGYSEELLPGSSFHLVLPTRPRAVSDQKMIRQIQNTNAETIIASPEMRKEMIRERERHLTLKARARE